MSSRTGSQTAQLKEVLEQAVARTEKHYEAVYTVAFRFEADDTSADRDTQHFQNFLRLLGLPKAKEVVFSAKSKTPGHDCCKILESLANRLDTHDKQCLIVCHYAGHGKIEYDELYFSATPESKPTLNCQRWLGVLWDKNEKLFDKADVVVILDSCFAGNAVRGMDASKRSVEVLCSVGDAQIAHGNKSNMARVQQRTFTSKLADCIAREVGRADAPSFITFSQIIQQLRATSHPDRMPEFHLKVGRHGVTLPLPPPPHMQGLSRQDRQSSPASLTSPMSTTAISTQPTTTKAIFTVHLQNDDPKSKDVQELIQWIHLLDPKLGLNLTGVWKTDSSVYMFEAPWHIWAELDGMRGVSLVCEAKGRNMLPELLAQGRPVLRENQPPSKGGSKY